MTRGIMVGIGLFLLAVWIAGLSLHAAAWITWLDFVCGILAIVGGFAPLDRGGIFAAAGTPFVLSLGLFAMWIVGLAISTQAWITWCTFAAACALIVDSAGGGYTLTRVRTV